MSFVHENYVGKNVIVALAGNVRHDDVVSLLSPLLSKIKGSERVRAREATYVGGYTEEKRDLDTVSSEVMQPNTGYHFFLSIRWVPMMNLFLTAEALALMGQVNPWSSFHHSRSMWKPYQ